MNIDQAQQELSSRKLALDGAIAEEAAAYANLDEVAENPRKFQMVFAEHQRLTLVRQRREREHSAAQSQLEAATRRAKEQELAQLDATVSRDAVIAIREPLIAALNANRAELAGIERKYSQAASDFAKRLSRVRALETELGCPPANPHTHFPSNMHNPV